jgi:hypothetical protein
MLDNYLGKNVVGSLVVLPLFWEDGDGACWLDVAMEYVGFLVAMCGSDGDQASGDVSGLGGPQRGRCYMCSKRRRGMLRSTSSK